MQQSLVSILVPFKNTSAFLKECLNSMVAQSYQNWEAILVNDHSTDDSLALVNEFATQDQRIRVFQNDGNGIIEALRTAYSKSKGQFISRMDSDDIMTAERLNVMVQALLHHGKKHIAIGQVTYFSDRGISNGYERYETWLNQLTEKGNNYSEIYKECVIPSPCWMVYREDLEACGAFTPNRYPEDYDLTFRFYENKLRCIPCDKILHYWRDYDTRTSRTSEHYAQNYFLDIKLHYFLKLDYNATRTLVVWGAGAKGKTIARTLQNEQVDFVWLCDNPNKIGKTIYGKPMLHYTSLETLSNPQSIITVANEDAQLLIRSYLKKFNHSAMQDYFFFC